MATQQILTGNVLQDGITYHAADINAAVNNATLLAGAVTGQPLVTPQESNTILLSNGTSLKSATLTALKTLVTTNVTTTGAANVSDGIALSGGLTLTINGGTLNNYAPSGFDTATWLHITASSPVTITGMVAPATDGTVKIISCASGTITLNANDAGSAAANRLLLGNSVAQQTMAQNDTATFMYIAARWRLIATS